MKVVVIAGCIAALTTSSVVAQGVVISTNRVPVPVSQSGKSGRTDIHDETYVRPSAGQIVSFDGLLTARKEDGKIVRARIGNMDDGMKTTYYIVLDKQGLQLAAAATESGLVHVKGRVEIKDDENWLVIQEFRIKK